MFPPATQHEIIWSLKHHYRKKRQHQFFQDTTLLNADVLDATHFMEEPWCYVTISQTALRYGFHLRQEMVEIKCSSIM
jgi:hypothetical protein